MILRANSVGGTLVRPLVNGGLRSLRPEKIEARPRVSGRRSSSRVTALRSNGARSAAPHRLASAPSRRANLERAAGVRRSPPPARSTLPMHSSGPIRRTRSPRARHRKVDVPFRGDWVELHKTDNRHRRRVDGAHKQRTGKGTFHDRTRVRPMFREESVGVRAESHALVLGRR